MALFQGTLISRVLGREVHLNAALPEQAGPHKTLYLMHALGENDSAYIRYADIERFARENNIAIIMPNADRSYYANTAYGEDYFTHLSEEIPMYAQRFFPLSDKREDNFIAGFSMGGYGALKIGLSCCDKFSNIGSISAPADLTFSGQFNGPLFKAIFGENNPITGTENDVEFLMDKAIKEGKPLPAIYMCCGTEDRLLAANRKVAEYFKKVEGLDFQYYESKGNHTIQFRNSYLEKIVLWMMKGDNQNV